MRHDRRSQREPAAFALAPVIAVVAVKGALTFAVAGRYGWHPYEL